MKRTRQKNKRKARLKKRKARQKKRKARIKKSRIIAVGRPPTRPPLPLSWPRS